MNFVPRCAFLARIAEYYFDLPVRSLPVISFGDHSADLVDHISLRAYVLVFLQVLKKAQPLMSIVAALELGYYFTPQSYNVVFT